MQRRGFENDEGTFLLDLFKIAMGVFIGGLAAMFTYEAITAWRLEQAAKKFAQDLQHEAQAMQAARASRRSSESRQGRRSLKELLSSVLQMRQWLARSGSAESERKPHGRGSSVPLTLPDRLCHLALCQ